MDQVKRNTICKYCWAIPFPELPFEDEPGVSHQPSLAALKDSASTCALCHLILKAVNLIRKDVASERKGKPGAFGGSLAFNPDGGITHFGMYQPGTNSRSISDQGSDDGASSESAGTGSAGFAHDDDDDDDCLRPWLFGNWWKDTNGRLQLIGLGVRLAPTPHIHDAEGNDGSTVHYRGSFLRIRTDDNQSSALGLRRIRRWAEGGGSRPDTALPSRLLDVGPHADAGFDGVRLVETGGQQRGRYIALSHCWGTSHTLTTTRSTIGVRRAGVALAALPKTYRDAVTITRALSVRYLWIDSLCIVQDDPDDWEREAAKMAAVYGGCYLTIAASCSTGDASGCFPSFADRVKRATFNDASPYVENKSDDPDDVSWLHRTPFAQMGSRRGELVEYTIPSFGCPVDPLAGLPLNTRAWTLQERLLSPRTLHLCYDQMYWELDDGYMLAEDGTKIQNTWFSTECLIFRETQPWSEHGLAEAPGLSLIEGFPPVLDRRGHGRWNGGWLGLIEDYTQRNMTRCDDKLPALSGVASFVARSTNDTYYAGLWKSHILEDLAWRVYTREETRTQVAGGFAHRYGEKLCDVVVPLDYRAPSWSWASLDAHIRFVPLDFARLVAEFLDAHVEPAGLDPFGKVSAGWIKLWAPLVEVFPCEPSFQPSKHDPISFGVLVQFTLAHIVSPDGTEFPDISYGEAFFDVGQRFPCFVLFLDSSNALLLERVDDCSRPNTFKRVGLARFLRTGAQRRMEPLTFNGHRPWGVPYGPMTDSHPRCTVTII
ncbi:heterokaryon incompatibility protein-domain-containing protein [Achaetomium macrosporum]|uniref:Heterokaryon incompatibility protein-domain-containing protein n=1 Tax=Achaetomium macrosporum TaxID=79813 RepID=A0AAN7C2M4_9PEZI|nr:heterokaryon incompatibility protein-domain-containing protein [Achaetomium macrosporum]